MRFMKPHSARQAIRFPTDEEISELVYEMFVQRRIPMLRHEAWRMAETILLQAAARQIPRLVGPACRPTTRGGEAFDDDERPPSDSASRSRSRS